MVDLTISAVNDAPLANAQAVTTIQDTAKAITLSGSDVEGSALSFITLANPTNGSLSGTAPDLMYTPNPGFIGSNSFAFVVNDGTSDSLPAVVDIVVNAIGPILYLGSSTSGTAGGIAFADEDILAKNQATGVWTMYFDGSDLGLANIDVDAFELQADGTLLMSFDAAITLTGIGTVDTFGHSAFHPFLPGQYYRRILAVVLRRI